MIDADPDVLYIPIDTFLRLFGSGGLVAGIIGFGGLFWKIKVEKKDTIEKAKVAAVDTSAKALDVVTKAMETQATQMENLTGQVTDLTTRVTQIDQARNLAVAHIGEREKWARDFWTFRPETLPQIPDRILPEVLETTPEIRPYFEDNLKSNTITLFLNPDEKDLGD